MGDWAEHRLSLAIQTALPEWKVAQYGNTDNIAAGHQDFKTRYLAGLEETRQFGKRPDLLLFPANLAVEGDLSERSHTETEPLVKKAVAAIEVRSSKFEALKYMTVRQKQRDTGNKSGRGDAQLHSEGRRSRHRLSLAGTESRAAELLPGVFRFSLRHQLPGHFRNHCQRVGFLD